MTAPATPPNVGEPIMLAAGEGEVISGVDGRLLASLAHPAYASTFEMTVGPGFDVGAHVHLHAEEMFFVLDGELDLLFFEPADRSMPDWRAWRTNSGQGYLRGGPGAFMYVPPGYPHAFANPGSRPVRLLFQSTVGGGHENYFRDMGQILRDTHGQPDPKATAELRRRYDTEQLTAMRAGGTG